MRGYRWGKFQGWATSVVGLIAWIPTFWMHSGAVKWLAEYAVSITLIFLGLGLVHKKRFALLLLYGLILVFVLAAVLGVEVSPLGWAFCIGWYVVPAIFYYPKRWKEFGVAILASPALMVEPTPPNNNQTETPKEEQPSFLPDLGKHLAGSGIPQKTMFIYPSWTMDSLSVVGLGHYCTTRNQSSDGNLYCATFDLNDDVLVEIMKAASVRTLQVVSESLTEDLSSIRTIPLPDPINVGIAAVLGNLQQGLHDVFIPLVVTEVIGVESDPKATNY